ncbi:MAG: HAD family phosphatase [Oscillospiraceae bacterium]|nr:HAD family phosphatase [Oscillospiraceae bacterium]
MIKNIVFDMGGVLLHYSPAHFIDLLSVNEDDKLRLMREVFQTVEWFQMDRGTITEPAASAAMKKNLPPHLHSAVDRLIEWWKLELRPMEGMAELLAELKGLGCRLYLLSNATVRQPEYFPRLPASQYFDGQLVSAFYQLLKPQREIYETLLRKFDLKAEECFFVDDSLANVEGAYCVGISGTVFDGDVKRLREVLQRAGIPLRPEQN